MPRCLHHGECWRTVWHAAPSLPSPWLTTQLHTRLFATLVTKPLDNQSLTLWLTTWSTLAAGEVTKQA
eukprot:365355-Chlamydomonas_euryale.AAC.3